MGDEQVMALVLDEARRIAAELVERRLRGLQRKVIAPKDREIAMLRQRLAAYEQEDTNHV